MPGGRPTKLTPDVKRQLKILASKGFTEAEMCEVVDIDQSTLTKFKQRNPKFFTSLKDRKAEADKKVEASLYERACGYSHPEDKIFCNYGEIIVQPTTKHYPPDTAAAFIWLKNRQPEKWRDKQELGLSKETVEFIMDIGGGRKD